MTFIRENLPTPVSYFENFGLILKGLRSAKWKTAACNFHGGSDSMRVNVASGAWVCMSCGEKGGDVLAYEIAVGGADFVAAAKAIGPWADDGKPYKPQKPLPLSPRSALSAVAFEAALTAISAGNIAKSVLLTDTDRSRLMTAAGRINQLMEVFA